MWWTANWIQQKFQLKNPKPLWLIREILGLFLKKIEIHINSTGQSIKNRKIKSSNTQINPFKEWEISKKCDECFECEVLHEIEMIQNDCHFFIHHRQHHVLDRRASAALTQIRVQVRRQRDHYSVTMVVFCPVLV